MVVNLCLPHFQTTAHCNKLSADGHDVSNLLSGDPVVRRRGFKLEYFLRPPLHVTLHFRVRVELCRVDVELWPCSLDQGSVSKRLEVLTCSDVASETSGQFKLVGRCDVREEAFACFKHPNFKPTAPFLEPPPECPTQAKQLELWSRGPLSLSSVVQLRVAVPFGGGASVLGIKSLAVWGVPARCCPPSELERFQKTHLESLRRRLCALPVISAASKPSPAPSESSVPEEFLDPLTRELMLLPMILPSGMIVDSGTLEEYQKQEATWGRLPNDPFTGIPFTKDSKPLPNPLLKSRIDSLMLRTGCTGAGSSNGLLTKPQPSKLTHISHSERPSCSTGFVQSTQTPKETSASHSTDDHSRPNDSKVQSSGKQGLIHGTLSEENVRHSAKRKYSNTVPSDSSPVTKISRTYASLSLPVETESSQASHEQRLSDSLDQALSSALQGLPTYTSQSSLEADSTAGGGHSRCGSCSCSLTVYSSSSPAYSLPCGHLLCRSCLHREHPPSSARQPVTCPKCKSCASPCTITRVHH